MKKIFNWERILELTAIALIVFAIFMIFSVKADAQPPHPSKHYKWEALPGQMVILYYLEQGAYSRYVYPMKSNVRPATKCSHRYENDSFTLITFDSTMPYWYNVDYKPIMKWDPLAGEDGAGSFVPYVESGK